MFIFVVTWFTNTVVHYCAIDETSQCEGASSHRSCRPLRCHRRLLLVVTPITSVTLRSILDWLA